MQHNQSSYKPLILIFLYIVIGTGVLPHIDPSSYMQNFMGLFFITFSYFKIINLNEFAVSFRQYDPMPKQLLLMQFLSILGYSWYRIFNISSTIINSFHYGCGYWYDAGIYQTSKSKKL